MFTTDFWKLKLREPYCFFLDRCSKFGFRFWRSVLKRYIKIQRDFSTKLYVLTLPNFFLIRFTQAELAFSASCLTWKTSSSTTWSPGNKCFLVVNTFKWTRSLGLDSNSSKIGSWFGDQQMVENWLPWGFGSKLRWND